MMEYTYTDYPSFNNYALDEVTYSEYNDSKDIIIQKYIKQYIKSFQLNIINDYILINYSEIFKFILDHDDLIEFIRIIHPTIKKYFPDYTYYMKYVPDPEFKSLNQLLIYVENTNSNTDFDNEWNKIREVKQIINNSDNQIKKLLDVDLW